MLQALSVFQGGFSISDVAPVVATTAAIALDLIDALTAKSLVDVTRDASGHMRHRLLETIRLFALSRLIEAGLAVETRDRHLEHFCEDPAGDSLEFMMSKGSVFRRGLEYENFRAAATWAYERGDRRATSRIAGMIAEMAVVRGEVQIAIDAMRLEAEHDDVEQVMIERRCAHCEPWGTSLNRPMASQASSMQPFRRNAMARNASMTWMNP